MIRRLAFVLLLIVVAVFALDASRFAPDWRTAGALCWSAVIALLVALVASLPVLLVVLEALAHLRAPRKERRS